MHNGGVISMRRLAYPEASPMSVIALRGDQHVGVGLVA
jgi:hypothetical protein